MEKRSRRRTRDLVTQPAYQGLSENEYGCARISIMARSTNAPFKGRIQKRKTNPLHRSTFDLQHTAGPYSSVIYAALPCLRHVRLPTDRDRTFEVGKRRSMLIASILRHSKSRH